MPPIEPPETTNVPAPPGEDRLRLPGPRGLWWALGVLAVALPLLTILAAAAAPQEGEQAIAFEVRVRMLTWRTAAWFGPPTQRDVAQRSAARARIAQSPRGPGAALPAAPTTVDDLLAQLQADVDAQRRSEVRELFTRAVALDTRLRSERTPPPLPTRPGVRKAAAGKDKPPYANAELVAVHAIATHDDVLAAELAQRIPTPSEDLRAALAAVPAVPPKAAALGPAQGVARARSPGFGAGWGDYTRDRVRARLYLASGDLPAARGLVSRLREADGRVAAGFLSLGLVILLAGSTGFLWLVVSAVRAKAGRLRGEAPLDWLRARYVGLRTGPRPYHGDPLVPLLGFGAWFVGYLAASLFGALLTGARPAHGLAVLLQSLAGVLLAYAVVQAFASRSEPLRSAARLGGPEATPFWQASTAALLAYCALLPVMVVVTTLSALLIGDGNQAHPVAGFLLEDADPLQIAALGVAVVIGAPIGEELLFRGFLYRILRQRFGIRAALWTTGLLFALLHMAPMAVLPYVTLGVAFALVYEWVGSLWASIVLHGLWNAVVFAFVTAIALS